MPCNLSSCVVCYPITHTLLLIYLQLLTLYGDKRKLNAFDVSVGSTFKNTPPNLFIQRTIHSKTYLSTKLYVEIL